MYYGIMDKQLSIPARRVLIFLRSQDFAPHAEGLGDLRMLPEHRGTGIAGARLRHPEGPGVGPWEPVELNRWAAGPASQGERVSASFLTRGLGPED